METVQKGDEMYHGVVLDILKTIFEVISKTRKGHYCVEGSERLQISISQLPIHLVKSPKKSERQICQLLSKP